MTFPLVGATTFTLDALQEVLKFLNKMLGGIILTIFALPGAFFSSFYNCLGIFLDILYEAFFALPFCLLCFPETTLILPLAVYLVAALTGVILGVWNDFERGYKLGVMGLLFGSSSAQQPQVSKKYPLSFLDEAQNQEFIPLTPEELEQAKSTQGLRPQIDRYQALWDKLCQFDKEIDNNSLDALTDDLGGTDIAEKGDTPILLIKQVCVSENPESWQTVTGSTYVCGSRDYFSLFYWSLKLSDKSIKHPVTNENLEDPAPYNRQPTRFLVHPYSGYESSQELCKLASDIRQQIKPELAPASSLSHYRLFSSKETTNMELPRAPVLEMN